MKACSGSDWQSNLRTRGDFVVAAYTNRRKDNYATRLKVERPRLAILTDIGGDPDDQQSMIRLMVYSNEFEIEALIASASGTPGELKKAITRPDLILEIVDAYERYFRICKSTHKDGLRKCIFGDE